MTADDDKSNKDRLQSPYHSRLPLASFLEPETAERFWSKVTKTDTCWLWTGATRKGYGKFHPRSGVTISAPRFAYFLTYGVDPGALDTLHSCDRPLCLNPSHIFLGTAQDNSDDKIAKGRLKSATFTGTSNPRAKLSAQDVEAIRARCARGETNTSIAKDYPVSHHVISRIKLGKAWKGPRTKREVNLRKV